MRVADAVADAAERLFAARVASPRVDAELLAAHVLGIPRARLLNYRPVGFVRPCVIHAGGLVGHADTLSVGMRS